MQPGDNDEIVIELDDHPDGDEVVVSAGPRRSWIIGVSVLVVAVVAIASLSGGSDRASSPSSTTRGGPTSVAVVPTGPAPALSSTVVQTTAVPAPSAPVAATTEGSVATTDAPVLDPVLPFGRPTNAFVYLTPTGGAPTEMWIYDIDAGGVHTFQLGDDIGWYVRAIDGAGGVVVEGGGVYRLDASGARLLAPVGDNGLADAPYGRVAAGPDGGTWIRLLDPPRLQLFDRTGTATAIGYDLPLGASLYGSMADGSPVVIGSDQRAMVISPGGARAPLATGPTTIVEHGRYVEWRCDARQRCTIIAHIAGRSFTVTDPTLPEPLAFRFEPDGTHLAIVRGGSLSIVDTATGVRFDRVVDDLAINYYSRNQPDTSLAMSVAFLPGSTGLVAATTRGLAFIDLEGVVRGLASHDSGNVPTVWSPLLGVGLGWPSGT